MRIGVIGDIHGNLPALELAIASIENSGVDVTVCLGDLVDGGLQGGQIFNVDKCR